MKTQSKLFTPASAFNKKFDMKQHSFASTLRPLKVNIFYSFFVTLYFHFCGEKIQERINITNYVPVLFCSTNISLTEFGYEWKLLESC